MLEDLITLGFLILLQAVLGFDNLLYISLESKRVPEERQAYVRKMGIGLAIGLRIVLLLVLLQLIELLKSPWFQMEWEGVVTGEVTFEVVVTLLGGAFIMWTALKEVLHMMHLEEHAAAEGKQPATVRSAVTKIVVMNLVFSFDSILAARSLTDNVWVMTIAIVVSGLMMIWLADRVSGFLARNRMYEVLGLFILFIVGVMLVSEGGHKAHLHLFGAEVTAMSKSTFYFVIAVLVLVDVVQGRYQKKLNVERTRMLASQAHAQSKGE